MKSKTWMTAALAGIAVALGAAAASAASEAPEASIPFADHDGIRDWNALDDNGIWIQSNAGKWYYGTFMAPCTGLKFENAVAFRPGPMGTLDRWSAISTHQTGNCRLKSLKASDTPPPSLRKPAAPAAAKAAAPSAGPAAGESKSSAAADAPD